MLDATERDVLSENPVAISPRPASTRFGSRLRLGEQRMAAQDLDGS